MAMAGALPNQVLADAIPDALLVVDMNGTIRFANAAAGAIFRVSGDDTLVGLAVEDLIPAARRTDHMQFRSAAARTVQARPMSPDLIFVTTRRDGSELSCQIGLSRGMLGDEDVWFCVVHDVSDRLESRALLDRARRWLAATTEVARVGTAELSESGLLGAVSARFSELVGCRGDLTTLGDLASRIEPSDRNRLTTTVRDAQAARRNFVVQARLVESDEPRWIRLTGDAIRGSEAGFVGWFLICQDVTLQRQAEQMLISQSLYDPLTNLPNRAMFSQMLAERASVRRHMPSDELALLSVDIDRFKTVNEQVGHGRGDRVLVEVAARLLQCTGPEDIVARVAADEFAIAISGVSGDDVKAAAERVIACFESPFSLEDQSIRLSASVGVATGTHASYELIRRNASTAAEAAKPLGGRRISYFAPTLADDQNRRHRTERAVQQALADIPSGVNAPRMVYQPIVDVRHGRVVALEALARFPHPSVATIDLIEFAEETGLIVPLGRRLFGLAIPEFAAAPLEEKVQLHLNVSPRQLMDPGFVRELTETLGASSLSPERVVLELTETSAMPPESSRVISALQDHGFRLAVDDFGSGHASLSVLSSLPVSSVKIDRSFVAGIDAGGRGRNMVATIVRLVDSLGLDSIAEGVETAGQRDFLLSIGCELMQGYFFARPSAIGQVPSEVAELPCRVAAGVTSSASFKSPRRSLGAPGAA